MIRRALTRLASPLRRNFALRIYAVMAVALAVITLAVTAASIKVQDRHLRGLTNREGSALAALVARGARVGVFAEDRELLAEAASPSLQRDDVVGVWVFRSDGRLLGHFSRLPGAPGNSPPPVPSTLPASARGVAVPGTAGTTFWAAVMTRAVPVSQDDLYFMPASAQASESPLGFVAVEVSDRALRQGRREIALRSAAAAGVLLLLAALVTALVVREAVRPLKGVLADLGRHGLPAPEREADDLGLLRDTFGGLVARLDRALEQTAQLNAGLERTVAERTAELSQANASLTRARDELEQRVAARTAELEQTHRQLLHAEKLGAVGRLAASVAHEFNNPIFGIRNVLVNVRAHPALDAETAALADLAVGECDRVARLIRDLQSFNRPSARVPGAVDLAPTLDAVLLLCRKELARRHAVVETRYDPEQPRVWGVEDQLRQVFLNLLTNAMDALPPAGGTIRISAETRGGEVAVRVEDNGSGISEAHRAHLFEPFFTTKPELKGTGLGLSVSHGIVTAHGGAIEVESRLGHGSAFTVRLPLQGAPP